ncbi:MAG: HD domain-containing phosphohydrolase [Chlorobiaceae bacterium]
MSMPILLKAGKQGNSTLLSLFHSFPDVVFIISPEGIILDANQAFASQLNTTPEYFFGLNVFDFMPPEVGSLRMEMLQEALLTAIPVTFDDESTGRLVRSTIYPYKSPEGNIDRLLVMAQDITDTRQFLKKDSFSILFNSHAAIQALLDPETGKILDVNQEGVDWYGWSLEELTQMYAGDINSLSPDEAIESLQTVEAKQHNKFLGRHRRADGSVRDVEIYRNKIVLDGKAVVHVMTHDITDRKRAEKELERLNRVLMVSDHCNKVLIRAQNEDELLQQICSIIVETGGYRMAWVSFALDDEAKRLQPAASAGSIGDYFETTTISWADDQYGQGPAGTAIRTGHPVAVNHILTDSHFNLWCIQAKKNGYAAVLGLPLSIDNRVVGALTIYSELPDAFNAEEIKLLTTLADNLAYGITMLRTREAKQRSEADLRQSEERFRKMFEEHSAINFVVDPDTGNIIDANKSAADFYGWSIEKLRTMHVQEISTLSSEEFGYSMQQVRLKAKRSYVSQHRRADGSIRDVESFPNVIEIGGKELVYAIIQDITAQKDAEQKILSYVKQLEGAMKSTLQAVAKVVEARDPYTAGHERRVGQIAEDIAREMGGSDETCQTMQLVGLVHDIGKISIPSAILAKPGELSATEFELIKTHAENGYQILHDIELPLPIAQIIREHHERMDGSGYPQGLKGENTLPESRILAVADVLEAMASQRPYRPTKGLEKAIHEIESNRGSLFDPDVVDAMLRLFREKGYQLPI